MSKKENSGCFLSISIAGLFFLGFILFGNVVDSSQNKNSTPPALTFVVFIIIVLSYLIYLFTKGKDE
jgi:membrane protein DedA with SNARE-associated domain